MIPPLTIGFLGATDAALKAEGAVGPWELFQHMLLLSPVHVEAWKKGNEYS